MPKQLTDDELIRLSLDAYAKQVASATLRARLLRLASSVLSGDKSLDEAERLRDELEFAVREFEDALPYVPEWAREKWGYDESLRRMRASLPRGGER